MRPRIALNIKSVHYEFVQETIRSNPVYKKITVLLHNGKHIFGSLIIVEYIDEFWSSSSRILPSDPYDRAFARFWGSYVDDELFPNLKKTKSGEGEARAENLKQLIDGFVLLEKALVKSSKGKAFFGGEEIGYLDIALGSYLGWIRAIEKLTGIQVLDEAKTPNLCKWAHAFSSHPAVKDVMPETHKLVELDNQVAAAKMSAAANKPT
ncbi:glutathione S-transferase U17-like [Euphorbia lathyris]|uniref:glutathione S-transferase U17-like n=1 Tax=Euphorbia lathyris TaxID=212925 RepID=UPI00331390CE